MNWSVVYVVRPQATSMNRDRSTSPKGQAYHYPGRSSLLLPMKNPSPTPSLSLSNSSYGSSNHHDNVPSSANSTKPRELSMLDGIQPHHNSQPTPNRPNLYTNALKFGLGGNGSPQVPPLEPELCPQLLRSHPTGILPVGHTPFQYHNTQSDQSTQLDPPPSHLNELLACCLIGKIWGDPVPLPAIIYKTKKDWHFIKGQVDYIDVGDDWVMVRFANAEDRMLVFDQRPWHVNGLNFVVKKWTLFFDSYTTTITRIDQWVRVPRLPWEFWDQDSLHELLKPVGTIVRIDQNTLLRLKGKFVPVCLNIDITQPLLGSLTIARDGLSMRAPLIYEGLHEICPLCGGGSHQLASCPKLPARTRPRLWFKNLRMTLHAAPLRTPPPLPTSNSPPLNTGWLFPPRGEVDLFWDLAIRNFPI